MNSDKKGDGSGSKVLTIQAGDPEFYPGPTIPTSKAKSSGTCLNLSTGKVDTGRPWGTLANQPSQMSELQVQ